MSSEKNSIVLCRIATSATSEEKTALTQWAESLLAIKESGAPAIKKLVRSIAVTAQFSSIRPLITIIARELTPRELQTLSNSLVEVYNSNLPKLVKLKRWVTLTCGALKELGWDNRGLSGRFGIITALGAAAIFGSQGAGIAALGTAIGVPLWVVFGAGAAFLGQMVEQFTGRRRPQTTYTVINAKRHDA